MNHLQQSWIPLSCLQLSGALSLPVILIGYYLGQHYSLENCLLQLLLGNLLLFALAVFYASVITQKKFVTIEFAQHLFGRAGTLICALGLVFSMLGWSAIQIHLMTALTPQPYLAALCAALLVYFLTYRDLAYLVKANILLLPLAGLSLAYLLFTTAEGQPALLPSKTEPFKLGFVMVLTAGSGLLFDLPTFYRQAASAKEAFLSLAFVFLVALPLIEGLGLFLATHYASNSNWIQSFVRSFNLPSLLFLVLSGLMGTCLNLYSATLVLNRTLGFSYQKTLLGFCLLSALLATINLEQQFASFLEVINLNAEIITVFTLVYVAIKGKNLPLPTKRQKAAHQFLLLLALIYALTGRFLKLSLFEDWLLDTAFISCALMSLYYFNYLTSSLLQLSEGGQKP
jgi:cytosine permease